MAFFTALLLASVLLASQHPALGLGTDPVTHRGKHFVITFAQVHQGNFQPMLLISADEETATVRVNMPRRAFLRVLTIERQQSAEVMLPLETRVRDNGVADVAVQVEANTEVSVIGMNRVEAHNDAFLALPTPLLGLNYYAVTWDYLPFINVAAAMDNTTLTFTFPHMRSFAPFLHLGKRYPPGSSLQVKLDAFQTYQIYSIDMFSRMDLSGTRVQADKPISVYSGSLSSKVLGIRPEEHHHLLDHLEEQLFPVNLWGTQFVMIHAPQRAVSSVLKLMACQDNTTVELSIQTVTLDKAGDFVSVDSDRARNFYLFESNNPIQATVFEKSRLLGKEDMNADPSMSALIPVSNFINNISVVPLDDRNMPHFVEFMVVVAGRKNIATLSINGEVVNAADWKAVNGTDELMVREVKIEYNTFYVRNSAPDALLMVYVFGSRADESYAFPAGFSAAYNQVCHRTPAKEWDELDNDCDGTVDEEPADQQDNDGDGNTDEDVRGAPIQCGEDTCDHHATCTEEQCLCSAPYYGEGRFSCKIRERECQCTAFGDPHAVDYNGQKLEMPLQCRYRLTEVALPDCSVTLHVEGRPFGQNPLVTLLESLTWNYTYPGAVNSLSGSANSLGVYFNSGEKVPFNTRVATGLTDVVFRVDEDYFYRIESKCDVQVRYRSPVVTVLRPLPMDSLEEREKWGLCGECTRVAPTFPLNVTEARIRALLAIDQDPSDSSALASECSNIQEAMQACPEGQREEAVVSCERLLDPKGPLQSCATPPSRPDLYAAIALCLDAVCKGADDFSKAFSVLTAC